jgi:hypothetical protein
LVSSSFSPQDLMDIAIVSAKGAAFLKDSSSSTIIDYHKK